MYISMNILMLVAIMLMRIISGVIILIMQKQKVFTLIRDFIQKYIKYLISNGMRLGMNIS